MVALIQALHRCNYSGFEGHRTEAPRRKISPDTEYSIGPAMFRKTT